MLIEVQLNCSVNPSNVTFNEAHIKEFVCEYLEKHPSTYKIDNFIGSQLENVVDKIIVDRSDSSVGLHYEFYHLNTDGVGSEYVETENSVLNAAQILTLPCRELEGTWESLFFDNDIKQKLLDYTSKAMLFADKCVDHNIISWNKIILLHGPPGTGKTSLCRGIAQKLAKRYSQRFRNKYFVEINAHSLFSKFFSESGKLVLQMFDKIADIANDENSFVCLLIDEVESLAHSRAAAASGNEPSDAIRVVNALLTQLDRLKLLPNVLILTTSNVESSIDGAFVDRADLCVYIGHPSSAAIAKIFTSCLNELIRRNLLKDTPFGEGSEFAGVWNECCRLSSGLSGRCLRKLPLLAYVEGQTSMSMFMDSLLRVIKSKSAEKKLAQTQHMFQSISLV